MLVRDRFFSHKQPTVPRNKKADLDNNWFQGSTVFFLTTSGTPVKRVNLEDFSQICGVSVTAGDLRKLFTTEIKHHKSQAVRDGEKQVAGHSDAVFHEYYNQRAAQTSHVLVTVLQEKRDTLGPVENLPTSSCIGKDRERRITKFQAEAEREKTRKLKLAKDEGVLHKKKPVSPLVKEKFIKAAVGLDPNWISRSQTMDESDWKALTLKLICQEEHEGKVLRECLKKIMEGEGRGGTRYSFRHHMKNRNDLKRETGREVTDNDKDSFYQVLNNKGEL